MVRVILVLALPAMVAGSTCAMEQGKDCNGNDLSNAPAATPQDCCDLCSQTTGCLAWTHDQYGPTGAKHPTCYLKSGCPSKYDNKYAVAGTPAPPSPPGPPAPVASFCSETGWTQVWSDEFNGTSVDTSVWTKDLDAPGDSRTRSATATADSVFVQDGALVIMSNGTWQDGKWTNLTSGAVQSKGKKSWEGLTRVCVRAKLPGGDKGRGIWPAHWMMPDDTSCWPCHGEIDIMEMINGDGQVHGTYHWCQKQQCGNKHHKQHGESVTAPSDFGSQWHEYGVEYDGHTHVAFAFDGKVYSNVTEAPFWDTPYYVILNTAVGGPWAAAPDSTTVFPTYHHVDFVRVSKPSQ